jgi:hypothetical protein
MLELRWIPTSVQMEAENILKGATIMDGVSTITPEISPPHDNQTPTLELTLNEASTPQKSPDGNAPLKETTYIEDKRTPKSRTCVFLS